MTKSTAADYC